MTHEPLGDASHSAHYGFSPAKLRAIITNKGMSIIGFARKMQETHPSLNYNTVYTWTVGTTPSGDYIPAILKVLQIPIEDLYETTIRKQEPKPQPKPAITPDGLDKAKSTLDKLLGR